MTDLLRPSRVGLVARPKLTEALKALGQAAQWLSEHGAAPVLDLDSARDAGLEGRWESAAHDELAAAVDVVVTFGGDGTLLDAAGAVMRSGSDTPLMGINLGRLGFLTEVDRTELTTSLEHLLAGRTRIETRAMLRGRIVRDGAVTCDRLALNDVVVTRSALSRMIETDVDVDGQFVVHVKADGLIVSSATGSTAYNLSVGGPIVHPSVDALVLTPIAPHTLTLRPLVLPATAEITMRPVVEEQTEIVVTFDGQYGVPALEGDSVSVSLGPRPLRLVRTSSRTYFQMLREKLKWGHT